MQRRVRRGGSAILPLCSMALCCLGMFVGRAVNSEESAVTTAPSARELGVQAVIYGLPLVMMDITMKNFINTLAPRGAPINQFLHERSFPPASFKQVVRLNVD